MSEPALQQNQVKPLRLSSLRICPRMAVLYGLDTPTRERYDRERRILHSGYVIGKEWLVMLAGAEPQRKIWVAGPTLEQPGPSRWVPDHLLAESPDDAQIIAEKPVVWAFGVGHEDAFIPETGTVIEVLSSSAPAAMAKGKSLQLVGYMMSDEEAESGALVIVDPRDWSQEERIIIQKGSPEYLRLADEVESRIAQVQRWKTTGELPERVCRHPKDAETYWCRVTDVCFEGWEAPAVNAAVLEKEVQKEVAELARQWRDLKRQEDEPRTKVKELEAKRKEVEAKLAELVEPGAVEVDGLEVKRSHRKRSTFKLKLAELDSRVPGELLGEFTRLSEFDVWSVEVVGEQSYGVETEEDIPF